MSTVTSHAPGVPSWTDLATPDPEAAKAFYGGLFGWEFTQEPTDQPGSDYIMARKGAHSAAGMMKLSEQMAASGMPPVWSTYVSVADIDVAAGKVTAAGGTLMQPPMDVMEAGRMAVLADPAGAIVCMWEPKEHIGAEVVNEPSALSWVELMTPDPAAVAPFYGEVFGWTTEVAPMPAGDYTLFHVEGGNPEGVAGAMAPPMPGMPSFWVNYFNVEDAAATVATAKDLGGSIMVEPMAIPGVGTIATIVDPQGAAFSIMTPEG